MTVQPAAATNAKSSSSFPTSISNSGFKVYGSSFKVDDRYQLLNPLGKGSYGIVCAAKDKDTGKMLAIKKVSPMARRTTDAKHTLREILLLQYLGKHPNIISIYNLSSNVKDDELYIYMDLMDTDMHRVIQSSQTLSESHVKYFLHQLLRGVKYLHENGVLHRDLKPGNLLLTKTCQLKIADFGLARKIPIGSSGFHTSGGRPRSAPAATIHKQLMNEKEPMTDHVVTRWYRAPELMLQPDGFYDRSVDMWSVGCIFAEILGRKALFPGKNFLHQLQLIFDIIGTPSPETTARIKSSQAQRFIKSLGKKPKVPFRNLYPDASDEALDLLEKLLHFDPEQRFTVQDALSHPYMQSIEKKYKCIDPKPSSGVDFSFDSKALGKADLRALIIKEVELFRKTAHNSCSLLPIDAIPTTNEPRNNFMVKNSDKEKDKVKEREKLAPSEQRVICGPAGMSMMHSSLRQNNSASLIGVSAKDTSTSSGNNRSRIRPISKPPVPKQIAVSAITVCNQQDASKVITTENTLLMNNFFSERISKSEYEVEAVSSVSKGDAVDDSLPSLPASQTLAQPEIVQIIHHSVVESRPVSVHQQEPAVVLSNENRLAMPAENKPVEEVKKSSKSPSPYSSSSSSDDDLDSEFKRIQETLAQRRIASSNISQFDTTSILTSHNLPRRVASAGPYRKEQGNISMDMTFVGSTSSLIKAQRTNCHQTLAEYADSTIKNIEDSEEIKWSEIKYRNETELNKPVSQKPVIQATQDTQKKTKRLTVPKSPKFSVMSWQKKQIGSDKLSSIAEKKQTAKKK